MCCRVWATLAKKRNSNDTLLLVTSEREEEAYRKADEIAIPCSLPSNNRFDTLTFTHTGIFILHSPRLLLSLLLVSICNGNTDCQRSTFGFSWSVIKHQRGGGQNMRKRKWLQHSYGTANMKWKTGETRKSTTHSDKLWLNELNRKHMAFYTLFLLPFVVRRWKDSQCECGCSEWNI